MPTTLMVAVGPAGSERELFMHHVARAFVEGRKPIRLQIMAVKDTAEAAHLLDSDKVQLAIVRSDEAQIGDARAFAVLDRRAVVLVTRAPPEPLGATQPSDPPTTAKFDEKRPTDPFAPASLIGKRIVVGRDLLGSNLALAARLLAYSGLAEPAITLSEQPVSHVAAALARDQADFAVLVIDPGAQSTRDLIASMSAAVAGRLMIGAPPAAEALASNHRDLVGISLAPGMFGGQHAQPAQKLATVAITDELVADSDMADALGTQLAKALLETRGRLQLAQRSAFEIEMPPLDTLRRFMPHSSVTANVSDKSTSFLETYSDQIWLGLFALGLIGSSFAGVAAWLGLDRPSKPNSVHDDIRRMVSTLDAATTVGEIDALRKTLRGFAGAQLLATLDVDDQTVSAVHPAQWYPIIDALAARRRAEIEGDLPSHDGKELISGDGGDGPR